MGLTECLAVPHFGPRPQSAAVVVDTPLGNGTLSRIAQREGSMPWALKGSYVETCSCELMCPCNLSFDHGATYDFCRVTLVFNIREGQSTVPISPGPRPCSSLIRQR